MTKSLILPADIMTLIFQYDNTFKELFSTKVLPQIWGSVLKRNVKSQKLNISTYFNCCDESAESIGTENDIFKSYEETVIDLSIGIEQGVEAVKVAANFLYSNMGFYDNYIKNSKTLYGTGDDFEPEDLKVTCIKLCEYVFNEAVEDDDSFEKMFYFNIILKINNKSVYNGFVYFDVDECKRDAFKYENSMEVYYDPIRRISLINSFVW